MSSIKRTAMRTYLPLINNVIIYKGHEKNHLFGPYADNIPKRIAMFNYLNLYREMNQLPPWRVNTIAGEDLVDALKDENPKETLLVIPAGQSTRLDKLFTATQTTFIKDEFLSKGGRGYFNCGSAYWVSSKRIYKDLCEEAPVQRQPLIKTTQLPLFEGISEGPLCPYPGKKYQVGFFSDAVQVTDGKNECTIYLSGGGSFMPFPKAEREQKMSVLVRYKHSELQRLGKQKEECETWENAVIMVSVGKGAALLSMFHPYYGPKDIDVERYEQAFPNSGTNWREIRQKLSSLDTRMHFVFNSMLSKLEMGDFG